MKDLEVRWTVLGSGSFVPSLDRGQSGHLLETGESKILIDSGITVPQAMEKFLNKPFVQIVPALNAILISHQHADHVGGLVTLIGTGVASYFSGLSGENPEVSVFLPEYSEHLRRDIELQFPEIRGEFEKIFKLKDFSEVGPIISLSPEIRVRVEQVEHSDYFTSYGFRFTIYGKVSIVYSGDTTDCEGLYRLLESPTPADLAVIEATSSPKTEVAAHHLNGKTAGRIAERCEVKKLLLTHISSSHSREEIFEEAREEYTGDLWVARDGFSVTL